MPLIYWRRQPHHIWIMVGIFFGLILIFYFLVRDGDRTRLSSFGHMPLFLLFLSNRIGEQYVLTPSVLTLVPTGWGSPFPLWGRLTHIPLTGTEMKAHKQGWRLRWRIAYWMTEDLFVPPSFAEAIERARKATDAAPPGAVPRTAKDARRAITVELPAVERWLMGAWAVLLVIVSGLVVWQVQPLYLLVLVAAVLWLHRWQKGTIYVVEGEHLWVLTPGEEPRGARLTEVQSLTTVHRWDVIVQTSNPDFPQVRISASGEMAKRLRRHLAGEVEPPFADVPKAIGASAPPVEPLRCTLCGSPAPTAHGRAISAGIHYCDRCAARNRLEAAESGHGIAGKDRPPL